MFRKVLSSRGDGGKQRCVARWDQSPQSFRAEWTVECYGLKCVRKKVQTSLLSQAAVRDMARIKLKKEEEQDEAGKKIINY